MRPTTSRSAGSTSTPNRSGRCQNNSTAGPSPSGPTASGRHERGARHQPERLPAHHEARRRRVVHNRSTVAATAPSTCSALSGSPKPAGPPAPWPAESGHRQATTRSRRRGRSPRPPIARHPPRPDPRTTPHRRTARGPFDPPRPPDGSCRAAHPQQRHEAMAPHHTAAERTASSRPNSSRTISGQIMSPTGTDTAEPEGVPWSTSMLVTSATNR